MTDELKTEMIQVAAVAVAMLEDLDTGRGAIGGYVTEDILDEVNTERSRQNRKWGPQHHTPLFWMLILMEEVGEAANEIDLTKGQFVEESLVLEIAELGMRVRDFLNEGEPT